MNDLLKGLGLFGGTLVGVVLVALLGVALGTVINWIFVHLALEAVQWLGGLVGFDIFEPTWRHSLLGAAIVSAFNLLTSKS